MKYLFFLLVALATSCAAPGYPDEGDKVTPLGKQMVTITRYSVGKYTTIGFRYDLPLANGQTLPLYGSNQESGYYYRKYRLGVGAQVSVDVTLFKHNDAIQMQDANFTSYRIPQD